MSCRRCRRHSCCYHRVGVVVFRHHLDGSLVPGELETLTVCALLHPRSPHNASWKMHRKATKSYYPLGVDCSVLNPRWHQRAARSYCSRVFDCLTLNPLPRVHFTGGIAWAATVVA